MASTPAQAQSAPNAQRNHLVMPVKTVLPNTQKTAMKATASRISTQYFDNPMPPCPITNVLYLRPAFGEAASDSYGRGANGRVARTISSKTIYGSAPAEVLNRECLLPYRPAFVFSCIVPSVGSVVNGCVSIFNHYSSCGVVMKSKRETSSVRRKAQDRRGFDFGTPAGCTESRMVAERRKRNVDLISGPDWAAYKALLGSHQRAIDKSFFKVFGSP